MYDKPKFEAAFQLITAVAKQIVQIDFDSVEQWIDNLMGPKSLKDPEAKQNMENLKAVMRAFKQMQATLNERGIPVRDISHYKQSRGDSNAGKILDSK